MAQQHTVVLSIHGFYSITPPEEGDVVETIVEDLRNFTAANKSYKLPSFDLVVESMPIASSSSSVVKEWNNEGDFFRRGKSDTCNLYSNCLNVNSKEMAGSDMGFVEGI